MKIATFNVNSIRTRLPLVLDWLRSERPDVLCLQETKVQDADFPAGPIQELGYHVSYRGQKAHAGVALISRQAPADVVYGLDDGGPADEARLIRAQVAGLHVINTYVPQGQSVDSPQFQYKLEWLARLARFFDRHYTPQTPAIWLGDFNVAPEPIDVHDPRRLEGHVAFHPLARQALKAVQTWGWVDVVRRLHPDEKIYTFWDYRVPGSVARGLGWRVDHIWATAPLADRCRRAWVDMGPRLADKPSDHTVLAAEFEF
jgi:exodeoxyribonuclease-3